MYDADILSEDTILKWYSEPMKARFSVVTDKFVAELKDVAELMIQWLE